MSLKERLNLDKQNNETVIEPPVEKITKPQKIKEDFYITQFKKYLDENINILVCCPLGMPTYNALNFLCSKISNDKRLVGIGSNLLLNPDEIIKFEPETDNHQKQLIQTALSLNPYKIILQNFDGVKALDIFKLTNGGIKNIIGAITAESAIKALLQAELNLYINGASVPETVMKRMISNLFDKIIVMEDKDGNCNIFKIFDVKPFETGEYIISEVIELKDKKVKKELSEPKPKEIMKPEPKNETKKETKIEPKAETKLSIKENVTESIPKPKNKLISKLKKKK